MAAMFGKLDSNFGVNSTELTYIMYDAFYMSKLQVIK